MDILFENIKSDLVRRRLWNNCFDNKRKTIFYFLSFTDKNASKAFTDSSFAFIHECLCMHT